MWIENPGAERCFSAGEYYNDSECDLVILLLKELLFELNMKEEEVGVIVSYNSQRDFISNRIATDRTFDNVVLDVDRLMVSTVDSFQGREKEVVIYASTRSNNIQNIGFLTDKRRFNVAITRARRLLIFIGNIKTLAKKQGDMFSTLLSNIKQSGVISYFDKISKKVINAPQCLIDHIENIKTHPRPQSSRKRKSKGKQKNKYPQPKQAPDKKSKKQRRRERKMQKDFEKKAAQPKHQTQANPTNNQTSKANKIDPYLQSIQTLKSHMTTLLDEQQIEISRLHEDETIISRNYTLLQQSINADREELELKIRINVKRIESELKLIPLQKVKANNDHQSAVSQLTKNSESLSPKKLQIEMNSLKENKNRDIKQIIKKESQLRVELQQELSRIKKIKKNHSSSSEIEILKKKLKDTRSRIASTSASYRDRINKLKDKIATEQHIEISHQKQLSKDFEKIIEDLSKQLTAKNDALKALERPQINNAPQIKAFFHNLISKAQKKLSHLRTETSQQIKKLLEKKLAVETELKETRSQNKTIKPNNTKLMKHLTKVEESILSELQSIDRDIRNLTSKFEREDKTVREMQRDFATGAYKQSSLIPTELTKPHFTELDSTPLIEQKKQAIINDINLLRQKLSDAAIELKNCGVNIDLINQAYSIPVVQQPKVLSKKEIKEINRIQTQEAQKAAKLRKMNAQKK